MKPIESKMVHLRDNFFLKKQPCFLLVYYVLVYYFLTYCFIMFDLFSVHLFFTHVKRTVEW